MIHLPLSDAYITRLESALQLYWKDTTATLSLRDFMTCMSKVDNISSSNNNKNNNNCDDYYCRSNILNLSKEERYFHDFYCIATPTLYDVDTKTGNWSFVELPVGSNRWKELRRLVQLGVKTGISKTKSQLALQILQSLSKKKLKNTKQQTEVGSASSTEQQPQTAGGESTSESKSNKNLADILLVNYKSLEATTTTSVTSTATTIEDRIRARTQERERNLEEAKAAQKDPREDRVAVADALFTHARHVVRRSSQQHKAIGGASATSRFGTTNSNNNNNNNNNNPTKCNIKFEDVVKTVLPNRSRNEITKLLVDIIKVSSRHKPAFIKWVDPISKKKNATPISKGATVYINTADYKRVRAILNGEDPPPPTATTSTEAPKPPSIAPAAAAAAPRDLTPVALPKSHKPVVTVSTKKAPTSPMEFNETDRIESHLSKKRPARQDDGDDDSGPSRKVPKSLKSLAGAAARTANIAQQSTYASSSPKNHHHYYYQCQSRPFGRVDKLWW